MKRPYCNLCGEKMRIRQVLSKSVYAMICPKCVDSDVIIIHKKEVIRWTPKKSGKQSKNTQKD